MLVISDSASSSDQGAKMGGATSMGSVPVPVKQPSSCGQESGSEKPVLRIAAGDMLSGKIIEWAKLYGYSLSWEIPELRAEGSLTSSKGFDGTLADFKKAMEMNDITFDVIVYENCVVRIVEVK